MTCLVWKKEKNAQITNITIKFRTKKEVSLLLLHCLIDLLLFIVENTQKFIKIVY